MMGRRFYRLVLAPIALLSLSACSGMRMMDDAKSAHVPYGKMIVVGKFEVTPPFPMEEHLVGKGTSVRAVQKYLNKVFFSTTEWPVPMQDVEENSRYWRNTLEATWGDTYFKQTEARQTYLNLGMSYLDTLTMSRALLPGGVSFTPPEDAKAVYIGTVRYTRDDFWNITKVQIIDEYKEAYAAFREQYGKAVPLKKALLRQSKR